MNVVLTRPYSLLDSMFDALVPESGQAIRARLDVIERPERYEVQLDLPGAKKEDIQVDIHENQVRISAISAVEIYGRANLSDFARGGQGSGC